MKKLHLTLLTAVVCVRSPALAAPPGDGAPKSAALIQIGVEVVEVNEDKAEQLGINWFSTLHLEESYAPSLLKVGTILRGKLVADIDFLIREGAADLLANPKLVTRDGTRASFSAGGQIPYIVSTTMGATSVEFKPYGVTLQVNPRLSSDGSIALDLEAEVSSIDEQRSVFLSGNQVPGLLARKVSSQLLLRAGTTVTLAGLIQNQKQSQVRRVPLLSYIPVLGWLFRHRVLSNRRTSIVVFVTPVLIEEVGHAPMS